MKTMTAKFAGKCSVCGAAFPKGATIVYNGVASHPVCVENERADDVAYWAKKDAEEAVFQAAHTAKFKAGLLIKSDVTGEEIMVRGAPTAKDARSEADAIVASLSAASGVRHYLVAHRRNVSVRGVVVTKRYVGREVVSYYGCSNLGHFEGYSYKFRAAA